MDSPQSDRITAEAERIYAASQTILGARASATTLSAEAAQKVGARLESLRMTIEATADELRTAAVSTPDAAEG